MAKRFNDREYLEHMNDREIEQWHELKAQMRRIHNRHFLALIANYASYRNEREWELQRQRETEEHIRHMKSLPLGTEVLVRFGELANHYATIEKHGRKYAVIKVDNGEWWKYPYWDITDKIDDEKEKKTAELNEGLQKTVVPVLNKVFSEMQDD